MRAFSWNRLAWISVVVAVAACGDSAGCAGCGTAPIPGGFPIADRIDNAAQIRLSQSGLQFLGANADALVGVISPDGLDFPIPRTAGSTSGIDYTLCPSSNCQAHAEVRGLDITPQAPNRLRAHARIALDSRNLAGMRAPIPTDISAFGIPMECEIDIDTSRGSRDFVGLVVDIEFQEETQAARAGYTKLAIVNSALAPGEGVEDSDISAGGCLIAPVVELLKGLLVGQLEEQVGSLIQEQGADALCTKRGETGCPTGTFAVPNEDPESICRFEDSETAECVQALLGTDGQGDLGAAFFGSLSPGTHGYGQFLLASGGEAEAVNNGLSLFFYGGFRSTDRTFATSPGHASCVPVVAPPALPSVPRVMSFRGNVIPGTTTPVHVGIGLSEAYLNHAGYGLFDSGLLCLGIGTRLTQQLSTGLFSLLVGSLRTLTFPVGNAPMTIALRPQSPPAIEIGNGTMEDALLTIDLDRLSVDFYVFSNERYIRFMTFTSNLRIALNLRVEDGKLVPSIASINARESTVTNSELLSEDPATLASIMETVVQTFATMLSGSIDPIELPALSGFALDVPEGGVRGVDDGGAEFLGIFANLRIATASALTAAFDTHAGLDGIDVDPASLRLETFGAGPTPRVRVRATATPATSTPFEFSYRLDGMPWSEWQRGPELVIEDRALLFQGRHVVEVRSRREGSRIADATPARVDVLIDVLAPNLSLSRTNDTVVATADDVLTSADALEFRFRIDGGAWSRWSSTRTLRVEYDDASVEVEARDEAGNVARATAPLVRGVPNAAAAGGCSCRVGAPSTSSTSPWLVALLVAGGGLVAARRRLRALRAKTLAKASFVALLSVSGCDCGGDDDDMPMPCDGACMPAVAPQTAGSLCCEATNMCVAYDLAALCAVGSTCASADDLRFDGCVPTCARCIPSPPLEPGTLATHLDFVRTASGAIFASGYSPGAPPTRLYGDLVVGEWDDAMGAFRWDIVDGVPDSPVTNDPTGWRDGISDPGPDVGRWSSIAASGEDLYVSYYDSTERALRFARRTGGEWSTHLIDNLGDSGMHSTITIDASGVPVIGFVRVEPTTAGRVRATARIATASSATPSAAPDWAITEIHAVETPCRPAWCGDGEVCLETGTCVTPTSDCAGACAMDEACVAGSCEAVLASGFVEDHPPVTGLFGQVARTPTGLAYVFYDRVNGNLMGSRADASGWRAPFLIDGYGRGAEGTGDSGLAASLFVDGDGLWHVTYVDGAEEALRYAKIEAGSVRERVTIDDGTDDGTTAFTDGRHLMGDDSSIVVTTSGEIRVVYQDATLQRTMAATRTGEGAFARRVFDDMDHTGFWLEQLLAADDSSIVFSYWVRGSGLYESGIRRAPF